MMLQSTISETYTNISWRLFYSTFFLCFNQQLKYMYKKERLPQYFLCLTIILTSFSSQQYFQEEKQNSFYSYRAVYQATLRVKYSKLNIV